ncbi:F0F1 ATP synthase subunit delta [Arthrobacter sp. H14]|uniref:F0F1 ATP synthase subunit delta n=1 Tax=Arthrobacter sp. H14 TaxID=1312959 RepID=UPI00047A1DFE|nr:F0F1 ATP synthase subunit delta [Arthrobacter sp. H14]
MAGVSGESLAAAQERLATMLPSATLQLAEELFGVLATLDSSAGLRRALTDPSRPGKDKEALAKQLFGGKVSADAETVIAGLSSSRWARARDIGDALETLAATVAIAVAERGRSGGLSGLERLENDLFAFNEVVNSSHELQRSLVAPQASADAKAALALKLVPNAGEPARVLIRQAAADPRGLKPTALVGRFVELVAERQERWIAYVTVTAPLSPAQMERLQSGLDRLYDRELKINESVDPRLVGGVRVKVGDEVLDASVISRLGELRRQLAG